MRLSFALVPVLLLPSVSFAQTEEMIRVVQKKLADQRTAKWVLTLEAPNGGFYLAPKDPRTKVDPQPSLRATNAAVKALKYLGYPLLKKEREKHAAFVLSCYDPKTGGFAEPGGKPDVTITAIGVMAAAELDVPHEKYAKAMDYLKDNAKTFEEIRIGAAAVEAWGVKDCPFDLKPWFKIADKDGTASVEDFTPKDYARDIGSHAAFSLRLGREIKQANAITKTLLEGQRADGAWGKHLAKTSDIETTYRVMRAFVLLKEKPNDRNKLREFIDSHYNEDGGYATKPGEKSSMSGVYYCVIVSHWLDEMERK
jgi:hypothetical protein